MRKALTGFVLLPFIVIFASGLALAESWAENGVPITTHPGAQEEIAMIPDGAGGSIVVWQDHYQGNWDIYAQRMDAWGRPLWVANGRVIASDISPQQHPQIVSDGAGGAIIMYVENQGILDHIRAVRVDEHGGFVWPVPVAVCALADSTLSVHMASDGAGGALLAWQAIRVDTLGLDIFAQRVTNAGSLAWAPQGVPVCMADEPQLDPRPAADGMGGAIVVWQDGRSGVSADIYAQRLDATGAARWAANGLAVCTAAGDQSGARLVPDGSNGAVIAWMDKRSALAEDIYAQRINPIGASLWTADGVAICTAANVQADPRILGDGAGGALIAWADARTVSWDVYAQKIDATGAARWMANGVRTGRTASGSFAVASNSLGGLIVAWAQGAPSDIYAQMLESVAGTVQWGANGVSVSSANGVQTAPAAVTDGEGGAIFAWVDGRSGPAPSDTDVYAQRIERNGYWGYPAPEIFAVRDVPGDQGGKVNLAWTSSRLDPWPNQAILNYSIWMAISPTAAASLVERGAPIIRDLAESLGRDPGAIRVATAAGRTFYWKLLGYLYASYLEGYSEHVQTLFDSTAVCTEYHYFQVIANASGSKGFWVSPPDSGYSVDNLAPTTPCGVAGRQAGPDLLITWHPNCEADLAYYAIYKGATEDFMPQVPILTSTDTVAVDTSWSASSNTLYYKLVAFDIHGNESPAALLRPHTIVATLLQSWSHSRGPSGIRIEWRLSECDGEAGFIVSRAAGADAEFAAIEGATIEREGLSFAFVDGSFERGASYRYRVEVADPTGSRVLFETGSIDAPAVPLTLQQNRPNPFNPSTAISYYLPEAGRVRLEIFDVSGRLVARLVDGVERAGIHEARWSGADAAGRQAGSGVYFYRLSAGKEVVTKKMVLMR